LHFSRHAAAVAIVIVAVAVEGNPAERKIAARDCRDDEIAFLIGDTSRR